MKENNVNKTETFKEDLIICKLNEIKKMNNKGKKLLLDCVNLKYNYDITWNNASSYKGPFVFNGNINYQKFTDDYFDAVTVLGDVINKGIYLYDYKDIENNDSFNIILEECLANYFALFEEYNHLLCNIKDLIDGGYVVEQADKLIEVRETMKNIITAINLSTWKNLSCCQSLKC